MPYTKTMGPQNADLVVHEAKLMLLMRGANALTRALTAAILESHGLLDEQLTSAVPITAAARQEAAVCRTQAAALRHEVEQLRVQAAALQQEAERLCTRRI